MIRQTLTKRGAAGVERQGPRDQRKNDAALGGNRSLARSASEAAHCVPRSRFGLVWRRMRAGEIEDSLRGASALGQLWRALPMALLLTLAASAVPAYAQDDEEAVRAGREGLRKPVNYPWYDKSEDEVRPVKVSPPPAPPKAGDWEAKTRQRQSRPNRGNSSFWEAFLEILKYMAYVVLIAVLVMLILLLVRAFLRNESVSPASDTEISVGTEDDVDRVEALPFKVRRPKGDLLAEARRHYEAGNFNEAIVYFYSYLLVELDKGQLIRLTRGKTNRQYLREVRRQPLLFEVLELTMIAFEDVFFGHHMLLRDRFERCFHRLTEFESRIQEAVA
jgi:hypothetical protein